MKGTEDLGDFDEFTTRTRERCQFYSNVVQETILQQNSPPLVLNESVLGVPTVGRFISENLPELPSAAEKRLETLFQLTEYHAHVIARDPAAVRLFEEAMVTVNENSSETQLILASKTNANLLCNDLFSFVKKAVEGHESTFILDEEDEVVSMAHSMVNGAQLGEIATMILQEQISRPWQRNSCFCFSPTSITKEIPAISLETKDSD